MKTALTICIFMLFSILSFAQQFQLEATIDKYIEDIFDIDGDGICEYVADTNKVYDGLTHNLKYTFPAGFYLESIEDHGQNPYSVFPHIDFNSDGKRDLIINSYTSQSNPVEEIVIFDVVNNVVLFEFNQPGERAIFKDCIDIDGDGELELVINTESGIYPNLTYKAYIYSTGVTTSVLNDNNIPSPKEYKLEQNYPNPFNPSTTIRYSIDSPQKISIKIYNISGQLIKEINREHNHAGEYEVIWDGKNNYGQKISSGAYFYQLTAGKYTEAKKMILIK